MLRLPGGCTLPEASCSATGACSCMSAHHASCPEVCRAAQSLLCSRPLQSCCRKPIRLHYLGVSFGLTQQLYNFWQRSGYEPLYVRQSASDVTGMDLDLCVTVAVAGCYCFGVEATAVSAHPMWHTAGKAATVALLSVCR